MKRYLLTGLLLTSGFVSLIFGVRALKEGDVSSGDFGDLLKSKGAKESPIEIVEYTNFRCGACKFILPFVADLLEKYNGKVKLSFRHMPGYQFNSLMAHLAAECAAEKGKFWAYHDKLFENQVHWGRAVNPIPFFVRYAIEVGLDDRRFALCLKDPERLKKIQKERELNLSRGIKSTPTFYIGDEAFVGHEQFTTRATAKIDSELKKRGLSS